MLKLVVKNQRRFMLEQIVHDTNITNISSSGIDTMDTKGYIKSSSLKQV